MSRLHMTQPVTSLDELVLKRVSERGHEVISDALIRRVKAPSIFGCVLMVSVLFLFEIGEV